MNTINLKFCDQRGELVATKTAALEYLGNQEWRATIMPELEESEFSRYLGFKETEKLQNGSTIFLLKD
jgi:hypothetical protein